MLLPTRQRFWSLCAAMPLISPRLPSPPHVIEKLLNHVSGQISGVAAIYNRFQYQDKMREAVSKWEGKLAALLEQPSAPTLSFVA